ncbi:MAG: hypothetical protein M5T61_16975 [Acidimicrobiia bacterium]|nr:hypothetical protein [Acidimicrobiia bacterium]
MDQQAIDELGEAVIALRASTAPELHPLLDAIVEDETGLDRAWNSILEEALDEG